MLKTSMRIKKKYTIIISIVVFICYTFLGVTLWTLISKHWQKEKRDLFTENAKGISNLIAKLSIEKDGRIYLDQNLKSFLITFSSNINADIFITDIDGHTVLCSDKDYCNHTNITVPQNIINEASASEYIATGTLNNIYNSSFYTVGLPVQINSKTIGIVFTSCDTNILQEFKANIFQMFAYTMISSFAFLFLLINYLTCKLVKPLEQMAIAAKSFGKGDFSQRVYTSSKDEIGDLALAFNNMADSLSASENTRRNFIANVSHELKTPMTTISGFIDGILDGTISSDDQEHYLNIVSIEIKRLSRLVKSMLNLSRIESGTLILNKQTFNISKVILDILISFEHIIGKKNIDIQCINLQDPMFVNGDIDMIHQVVYNLIENSVKFVNDNGYIKISTHHPSVNQVEVSIKNSGAGIQAEDLSLIFGRFYKVDRSRSKDKNGMGLGLYIVKSIINLHKGTISATSIPEEYFQVTFSLPAVNNTLKYKKENNNHEQ